MLEGKQSALRKKRFAKKTCGCTKKSRCLLHIAFGRISVLEEELEYVKNEIIILEKALEKESIIGTWTQMENSAWQANYLAEVVKNKNS